MSFQFGLGRYELDWRVEGGPTPPDAAAPSPGSGSTTTSFGAIRLNAEQRQMLGALCEPRLSDPEASNVALPSNAEIAHRLGWSLRKFDRKLDYVCRRLSDAGVPGLRGTRGQEASDRRIRLVEHMVQTRIITDQDIPASGGFPR